ncbi:MAG: hypothetical protein KAW40_03860 [Candidatus Aenigmarchaeota archaeon]|nr:hypothetical protein [Candidatus Aenigmarchaeota archaeon]
MKGQVWSLDFITSVLVFLVVLIPLFFVWNYVNIQNQQQILFDEVETLTLSISDSLIRTKGLPEDWNTSDVSSIGLSSEENVLNVTKVSYFLTMGNSEYNRTRAILTGGYDFFFNLTDINGTAHGTIGNKPQDRMTIPIERYCLYNERIAKLEFAMIV